MLDNSFGEGIANLVKQLVYMKLSIFIEKYPDITSRLFTIPRLILDLDFSHVKVFSTRWIKVRKKSYYDNDFISMNDIQVKSLQTLSQDPQYETEIMTMFKQIKATAVELTNPVNNPNIYEVSSNRSRKSFNDDNSTLKSTESCHSKKIPTTVSLSDNHVQNNNITGRKFRNTASSFSSYENVIKRASKLHKTK